MPCAGFWHCLVLIRRGKQADGYVIGHDMMASMCPFSGSRHTYNSLMQALRVSRSERVGFKLGSAQSRQKRSCNNMVSSGSWFLFLID